MTTSTLKQLRATLSWLKGRLNANSDPTVQKYIRQVEKEIEALLEKNRRL